MTDLFLLEKLGQRVYEKKNEPSSEYSRDKQAILEQRRPLSRADCQVLLGIGIHIQKMMKS
jgi:hypothetical protein